jgi:hypothetical protein
MTDTRQIIDYAFDEDAKGVREAMYASLHDRIMDSIEAKKQEVGANLVGGMPLATEEVEHDEDTLDEKWAKEEKEEDHDDEKEDKALVKKMVKKDALKENEIEEGVVKKVGDTLNKGADALGDAGNAIGSLAGKALGGVAKTVGVIRQTPAAVGQAYNMGRAGGQKAIAK